MTLIELAAIVIAIVFWPVTLCVLVIYVLLFWVAPILLALVLAVFVIGSPAAINSPIPAYLMEPKLACFNRHNARIDCDGHHSSGETFGTQSGLPLSLWDKDKKTFNSLGDCQTMLDWEKRPETRLHTDAEKGSFNWAFNQMTLQSVCVAENDPRLVRDLNTEE
jgi:hypothetical protein